MQRLMREPYKNKIRAQAIPNKVTWVNADFNEFPMRLGKVGKASKLGVFLTPIRNEGLPAYVTEPEKEKRSAELAEIAFRDRQGRVYYEVDAKGIGYAETRIYSDPITTMVHPPSENRGLAEKNDVEKDCDLSEYFFGKGARMVRHIAHIEPYRIIYSGKSMTIDEARTRRMLSLSYNPRIALRAFVVRQRTFQLENASPGQQKAMLDNAMTRLALELGKKPGEFTPVRYADWMAESLGKTLAIIHQTHTHNNLGLNICLDSSIVDNATAEELPNKPNEDYGLKELDLDHAIEQLEKLALTLMVVYSTPRTLSDYIVRKFRRTYLKESRK